MRGSIEKMRTQLDAPVRYELPIGGSTVDMNALVGQSITLSFTGAIFCIACGRKTKKSFNQGHCFPCLKRLASCDQCIVRPELCHYHAGTCREPQWGESHCLKPHVVYLANSSGIKVGITRQVQQRTRWMDQGATQALPVLAVDTRLDAGNAEVALKRFVSDKTDWRKMLKGDPPPQDLRQVRDDLFGQSGDEIDGRRLPAEEILEINYPVLKFPDKVRAHNLDKSPILEGTLMGIKGQYWMLDEVVINIRKYAGYRIRLTTA